MFLVSVFSVLVLSLQNSPAAPKILLLLTRNELVDS